MSFVTTQPEALAAAAGNLQAIGSTLSAQNAAAAAPTTGWYPPLPTRSRRSPQPSSPRTRRCTRQ